MWIKLAINVAFSSILTLPLSVFIQRGAVQKHNMNLITADIEEVERKIDEQNNKIAVLQKKKEQIDANWRFGNSADGSRNEAYFRDKEQARQDIIEAKAEKSTWVENKKILKEEYAAYERGDLSKVALSFPEQFYHMMSQARWTDNLLNLAFFTITALMGSGAVLIKTFVFGTDSYTKKLQALEDAANNEEELKNVLNTSAQQVYYSLFNTDVTSGRLKNKIQRLDREFELETERMATWLYEERIKQMQQQIRQQAIAENLEISNLEFDSSSSYRVANNEKPQNERKRKSPQIFTKSDRSNSRFSKFHRDSLTEKKSQNDKNVVTEIKKPKKDRPSSENGKQINNQENPSLKITKDEDFMTLFEDIDRQIDLEKN